ncbi:MAG TPA: dicarboxylate/amino acid:cation symporter [Anaerohalosphaeraceae bacterium]|nr:dicarboxylate/amino acid:cation symporter [Anaerohalosphaeraceae bacterium]HOL31755.1 dicarboxylate/amino acid:cation symporter [Anaerohalosphaeraceae bacterium]HOM74998.1 dicarboxylate/amino acid:cation symporter [Anaerohalosphaeraceae bacterium]HPC63249.1 dicarboxylate/amino acid:cation symporter [Anaerohalosphaeraceae bacterium]HRS72370.1 dicarboxylate/amino acid:cation symporter [Anaerohalosphaeraceae bacterium]
MKPKTFLQQWRFTIVLTGAVLIGSVIGVVFGSKARLLKPFGDLFLNLLFCAAVPLVFFSIASAVASSANIRRLGQIAGAMLLVFALTGIISSCLMLTAVKLYDPGQGITLQTTQTNTTSSADWAEKFVETFTVPDFTALLSRQNMLALIVFSLFVGLASQTAGQKGRVFQDFLCSGAAVMGKVISLIMLYAPIGLGAYFAYLVGALKPQLADIYIRAMMLYYPLAFLYFGLGFSVYVLWAGGVSSLRQFWTHIPPVALTAWGTGSSLAALPVNMEAARRIGIPEEIREIILPLGAIIHMDGTCLAAVVKIAVLFSIYGHPFAGIETYLTAIGVSLLCGVVMSGIPGGGFLGEVLIVSFYGFGAEALPIISIVGTLVDPPATMVNASGDTVAAIIVSSWLGRKTPRN